MSLLLIILVFMVLWFVMIRPQMKCQRETKAMFGALVRGDEVVTAGGILDKVSKVAEQCVTVGVATNTEVIVQKNAVMTMLPKGALKALQSPHPGTAHDCAGAGTLGSACSKNLCPRPSVSSLCTPR